MLRREDGHVLRWASEFEVDRQWKNERPEKTWKNKGMTRHEGWYCQA